MVDFLVVDSPSTYNMTLDPYSNQSSTINLSFEDEVPVGEVKSNQMMARKCYATNLLEKVPKETLSIENLEAQDESSLH